MLLLFLGLAGWLGSYPAICYFMRKILFVLILLACLAGCCSPRVAERIVERIEYRDRYVRDSLYLRDSIYLHEYSRNDTVYIDKYIDRWRYRDRYVHDTLYVEKHDTTQITVVEKVEKALTPGQKAKLGSFWYLAFALLGFVLWTFRKPLLELLRRLIR